MSSQMNDTALITLMHELRSFVRSNMERPEVLSELRYFFSSKRAPMPRPDEIARAFELLAPGLMVDFLEAHPEIINRFALRRWATEREVLHSEGVNLLA